MSQYIMALDAGTTSNRCILFNRQGEVVSSAQKEFTQYFPEPGWVEHDAMEIWNTQLSVAREAMANIHAHAEDIAAIGITNQRETTIIWDKATGEPIYHAIVWQCRRTSDDAKALKEAGWEDESFIINSNLELSTDGLKIKWRPDLCYRLKDGRKVFVEIKTDLSQVSKDWLSAINQILHGEESFIFILTTGYYYEVHISGIKQYLKSSNPPTIEDILKWEKEVR